MISSVVQLELGGILGSVAQRVEVVLAVSCWIQEPEGKGEGGRVHLGGSLLWPGPAKPRLLEEETHFVEMSGPFPLAKSSPLYRHLPTTLTSVTCSLTLHNYLYLIGSEYKIHQLTLLSQLCNIL